MNNIIIPWNRPGINNRTILLYNCRNFKFLYYLLMFNNVAFIFHLRFSVEFIFYLNVPIYDDYKYPTSGFFLRAFKQQ